MEINEYVLNLCSKAKNAQSCISSSQSLKRDNALTLIAQKLREDNNIEKIISENEKDIKNARDNGTSEAMIDRLTLDRKRIIAIADSISKVIAIKDPLGCGECFTRPNGLKIKKVRVPLGTIGIIYEARPNVTVDAGALCIKTGNTVVLRGGKEAISTNKTLIKIMKEALVQTGFSESVIELIEDTSRESSKALMEAVGYIDVLIPRGGKGLIRSVVENAKVPVIETGAGNCHIYIEKTADLNMALDIAKNAKLSRPSVCNAAETLLVDSEIADKFLPMFYEATREKNLIIRGCEKTVNILGGKAESASEDDYFKEYNDYIIAVRAVAGVTEAVSHINKYNTKHSEAIVTSNSFAADYFCDNVDAAAVYVNASTRFTDGEEFGFGAEIGISTQKLHARGPMGANELTTSKYIICGNGQIR